MKGLLFKAVILCAAIVCSVAGAADCQNCVDGLVGEGRVKHVCRLCDGEGVVPDPPPIAPSNAIVREVCDGSVEAEMSASRTISPTPAKRSAGSHRQAVCRVIAGKGASQDVGSGVLVEYEGRPIVLTAWHVVRGNRDKVVVHFQDQTKSAGRVWRAADDWDVAAIEVTPPSIAPAVLAETSPDVKERLTLAGFGPVPSKYREDSGMVMQFTCPAPEAAYDCFDLKAFARHGDSGCPAFNARGEVAGIIWGCSDGLAGGTGAWSIRRVLADAENDPAKLPVGPFGVAFPAAQSSCATGKCGKPSAASSCPTGRCQKR